MQSTMKFHEAYCLTCEVMQGRASVTWDSNDLPGLSGFIFMRLAHHNRYIHCVQSTMKVHEAYCLTCEVMQGRASVTWDSK